MSTATEVEFVGSSDLISAILVYDGGTDVLVPPQMGEPREDQMDGSPAEQLSELAGRVCYDSCGTGRPSFTQEVVTGADPHTGEQITKQIEGYHDHILKVGHGSVLEHFHFTIGIRGFQDDYAAMLLINRPGIYFQSGRGEYDFCLTVNLRAIHGWAEFSSEFAPLDDEFRIEGSNELLHILQAAGHQVAPHIIKPPHQQPNTEFEFIAPETEHERWVSLFISGSRGLSHELVRHGDFTAISQRSTRFVDESESQWVQHPLEAAFIRQSGYPAAAMDHDAIATAQRHYRSTVALLEPWLNSRGVDKTSARKQARGAARGYIGNALYTELIFSASVAQWKRILRQRASVFADAEIREMACKALIALKQSRYDDRFENWRLEKSPDGIGFVAVESK